MYVINVINVIYILKTTGTGTQVQVLTSATNTATESNLLLE